VYGVLVCGPGQRKERDKGPNGGRGLIAGGAKRGRLRWISLVGQGERWGKVWAWMSHILLCSFGLSYVKSRWFK
jgi:hypothetical protein